MKILRCRGMRIPRKGLRAQRRKRIKVGGRCATQPVKDKLDFMSMRSTVKWANKTNKPIFLCVLKANELPAASMKRSKIKATALKGQNQGEKKKMLMEKGPVKEELTKEELIKGEGD